MLLVLFEDSVDLKLHMTRGQSDNFHALRHLHLTPAHPGKLKVNSAASPAMPQLLTAAQGKHVVSDLIVGGGVKGKSQISVERKLTSATLTWARGSSKEHKCDTSPGILQQDGLERGKPKTSSAGLAWNGSLHR